MDATNHSPPFPASHARPEALGRPAGWSFVFAPGFLVLLYVFVLPIVLMSANSLRPNEGYGEIGAGVTLENYRRFLGDAFYWGVVLDTVTLGLVVVAICVVISYPVAYFLARDTSRWRGIMTFAVLSPLLISVIIRNLGWLPLLGRHGIVNTLLMTGGIIDEPLPLLYSTTGVVIGLVHGLAPFMVLSLTVVIRRIDIEIEQAASGLGAGRFELFCRVILPLSRQGLLGGSLLVFSLAISAFTTVAMMGGRRSLFLSTFVEQQVRTALNYPFGATASVILLSVTTIFSLVAMRTLRGSTR